MLTKQVFAAAYLSAAGILSVGNAVAADGHTFDGRFLEAYDAEFEFFIIGDDQTLSKTGTWTDIVTLSEANGREVLRREVARYDLDGVNDLHRVMSADQETLAPVRTDQRFGPDLAGVFHVDYAGADVAQVYVQSLDAAAFIVESTFEQPPYDLSLWATLAMSLPFEVGREAVIPVIGADRRSLDTATLRVVGPEQVAAMGSTFDAWKVEAVEADWVFWVRKEKPYIVRIDHPFPGGGRARSFPVRFD